MMMMMLSPVFSVSRLLTTYTPLPNSLSPQKPHRTAGKRTVERRRTIVACFSPPKSGLAESEINGDNSTIQLRGEVEEEVIIPKHVAMILDGNGRWAKNRGLTVQDGHKNGRINLKYVVSNCSNLGIKLFSVYAFSTENWNRSKAEVEYLMKVFEDFIESLVEELMTRHDIRFSVIGNKARLPESLQRTISWAEEMSGGNGGMHFVMALGYSGRDDVVQAAKSIASKVEDGTLRASDVDQAMFQQQLMTDIMDFPSPDLMIRTSGEVRISNFFLWQLAYTELYFTDKLFPDFGAADLLQAFASYQSRHRSYGGRNN